MIDSRFAVKMVAVVWSTASLISCGSSGSGATLGSSAEQVASGDVSAQIAAQMAPATLDLAVLGTALSALKSQSATDPTFNCTAPSESPTSAFDMTCTCSSGGTATISFDDGFTQTTCSSNDTTGTQVDIDTTGTTTYTDCVVEECSQTVTLNGTDTFTVQNSTDDCSNESTATLTVQTAQSCSGVIATVGSESFTMGYNINSSTTTSNDTSSIVLRQSSPSSITVDGTFCTGGTSFDFTSLTDFDVNLDPDDLCPDA